MAKKNNVTLTFNYSYWSTPIAESERTKSVTRMKKILANNIRTTLIDGYKQYGDKEPALKITLPFFPILSVTNDMVIRVNFADDCKFKFDKFSKILQTRTEFGEISVDGEITVTIKWKV